MFPPSWRYVRFGSFSDALGDVCSWGSSRHLVVGQFECGRVSKPSPGSYMFGATMTIINDAQHWRERAKEARAMSDKIVDPVAKAAMLKIAESYDEIAVRAEARVIAKAIDDQTGAE
jgi:hypothetical protein